MVAAARWRSAQGYERNYWSAVASRIANGSVSQLNWYAWRAGRLAARLSALGLRRLTDGHARVLEVGSGPVGIVAYFPAEERLAVDPLETFYAGNPVLSTLRSPDVEYRQGLGEELPCDSGRYDLAIIENCIDHVQDSQRVMSELVRVLTPNGVLYLTVNGRTRYGYFIHRLLSRLRLDVGHPHSFTPARAKALVERWGFRILDFEVASYVEALRGDLHSPELRTRLKGVLGVSEFLVTVVGERATTQ